MEMQLDIFQGSWAVKNPKDRFSQIITTHWLSNVRQKTQRKGFSYWDCFGYKLISDRHLVLKDSIAIIQKLKNKTLSKGNFFLRYTDNETQKVSEMGS